MISLRGLDVIVNSGMNSRKNVQKAVMIKYEHANIALHPTRYMKLSFLEGLRHG
ncbi:MAG: hypothetical protein ACE5IO_07010 [Thermoplasmata archaeon]